VVLQPEAEGTLLHRAILPEVEVLGIQEVVRLVAAGIHDQEAAADLEVAEVVVVVAEAEVVEETKKLNSNLKNSYLDNFPEYLIYF
jgi:hypothetical protein